MLGILLTIFLSASPSHATPIACEANTAETNSPCHYRSCLLPPDETYGRPSLVLYPIPSLPNTPIRVHLHGWTQDEGQPRNEDYDIEWLDSKTNPSLSDLKKFWNAYGLFQGPCSTHPEIVVVPLSRGHNDDHLKYFTTPDVFNRYLGSIAGQLRAIQPSQSEIHLSAHSGGGKILSQVLELKDQKINRIKIFDGIYHASTGDQLSRWLNETHHTKRVLELYSVTSSTYSLSREIRFPGVKTLNAENSVLWIRNPNTSLRFEWILDGTLDHYALVPNRFSDQGWSLK